MKTYTGDNHHAITIIKSAALKTSTSFWTAAVKTVLNITKVVSHYHIIRRSGAEQLFKLCILYCVCTQSTHSQCSLTFAGQITEYTEGQMHVCTKSYMGIGIEADAAGIGIPASCLLTQSGTGAFLKRNKMALLGILAFSGPYGILGGSWHSESVATLPPFGPIEGQKWFDRISSQ